MTAVFSCKIFQVLEAIFSEFLDRLPRRTESGLFKIFHKFF